MSTPVTIKSQAKINLRLKIVGVRDDGYHLIESLFAPITLSDEIEIIEYADEDQVIVQWNKKIPVTRQVDIPSEKNLVTKALKMAREKWSHQFPKNKFFKIVIHKSIPSGAGLGGSSSNAVAVLKAVGQILGGGMDHDYIKAPNQIVPSFDLSWVHELGADCPFFVQNKPAKVSGIGEKINPWPLPAKHLLVWAPDFEISTPQAYRWYDQGLTPHRPNVRQSQVLGESFDISFLENDLEAAVSKHFPKIEQMKKELLDAQAKAALMTGSGSSVFGIFESEDQALEASKQLQSRYNGRDAFFVCQTTT